MDNTDKVSKKELIEILVVTATRFQKFRASFMCVDVGQFWLPGFTDLTTFYLFKCRGCRRISADYVHGKRRLYCHLCDN